MRSIVVSILAGGALFSMASAGAAKIGACRNVSFDEAGGVRLARGGEEIPLSSFADGGVWTFSNYEKRLSFATNRESRVTVSAGTNKADSAWCIRSKRLPMPAGMRRFRFAVEIESAVTLGDTGGGGCWSSNVTWFDAAGNALAVKPLRIDVNCGAWSEVSDEGPVPTDAAAFSVQVGSDDPNLDKPHQAICFRHPRFTVSAEDVYGKRGVLLSEVRAGGAVSWCADTPRGTSVRFQYRGAETAEELSRAPFVGPGGDSKRFYGQPFRAEGRLVQYRAVLEADGTETPCLRSVTCGRATDDGWSHARDVTPPRVEILSPVADMAPERPLRLRISDESAVCWGSFACRVDGADVTGRLAREGDVVALAAPAGGWAAGLHRVTAEVADFHGNRDVAKRGFFIGARPPVPRVTLREDGMTLVDGRPFFPIGIYSVVKRKFNGHSYDRAFADLKAAGFNLVHTYANGYADDFLAAARKYDMKLFIQLREPNAAFVEKGLPSPDVLAWYLGDDTYLHETPSELFGYHDTAKAIDPNRLTVQADWIHGERKNTCYAPYVTGTDVFLPEIYPLRSALGDKMHPGCVAETIRDMRRCRADIASAREEGDARPHGLWPIIQYFTGWSGWKEFPTRDELFATSFAAIAEGAHGITWYTYGGSGGDDPKCHNYGVTSTPERWRTICELAGRIRELTPFLVAPTPRGQPGIEILEGPSASLYAQPACTALMKRAGEAALVIAVNATDKPITVRFSGLGPVEADAQVLWENRNLRISEGTLTDAFSPFAVHVYRFL